MWDQKCRPAGWNLRQELTLLSWGRISSSSRKPQVLLLAPLTDWMRQPQCWEWSPLLKFWWWIWATSTKYLHNNIWTSIYMNHWRLAQPRWHPELTITVSVKLFALQNPNICSVITDFCSPLVFALKYIVSGEQSLLGKRGFLLKILTCKMPSSDLWSCGVWTWWARRTVSVFWSLSIPILVSGVWGLGNVSVWVTVVSAPGCLHPARLVACILVSDSCSDPKCCEIYTKTPFPQNQGERWGSFSLLFWPSRSFPEERWKFLRVVCDPQVVSPHVPPFSSFFTDNSFSFFELLILYWDMANQQCCDSFIWTVKGCSHTYTCTHSPPNFTPIQAAT